MNAPPLVAVIDDDPGMRLAVDALIRSLDYRAAPFSSAEDFLASAQLHECSCIISDVKMGGMSGIELLIRLQEPSAHPIPPMILVSAFMTDQMKQAAKDAGATAVLKKPFDADVLVEHIERAISAPHV